VAEKLIDTSQSQDSAYLTAGACDSRVTAAASDAPDRADQCAYPRPVDEGDFAQVDHKVKLGAKELGDKVAQ
jgi:hypothetical protein